MPHLSAVYERCCNLNLNYFSTYSCILLFFQCSFNKYAFDIAECATCTFFFFGASHCFNRRTEKIKTDITNKRKMHGCRTCRYVSVWNFAPYCCPFTQPLALQRHAKMVCLLSQLFGKVLCFLDCHLVRKVQRCFFGGHCQLLEEGTQVVAFVQEFLAVLPPPGFTKKGVY